MMIESAAEAMWQEESRRAGNRPRLIPWSEEGQEVREKWIGLARTAAALLLTAPEGEGAGLREALRDIEGKCELARSIYQGEPIATPEHVARSFAVIRDFARTALTKQPATQEPAAAGVDRVRIPTNADQAVLMWLLGEQWVRENAPERLRPSATLTPSAPKTPDAATGGSVGERCPVCEDAVECADLGCAKGYDRNALAQLAPVGEDDTGLREAAQFVHDTFARDIAQGYQTKDKDFAVSILGAAIAPQPPKAETPAEPQRFDFVFEVGFDPDAYGTLPAGHPFKAETPAEVDLKVAIADEIRSLLEGRHSVITPYSIARHLCRADGPIAALSTAPAARPGDEVERADAAMHAIWTEWITFYNAHFRTVTGISAADQMAFYEIAQPILRELAAAPAADGGRA